MYYDDDDYLYEDDSCEDVDLTNITKVCSEKKEYKGSCCRSCGEHNPYAEADNIVNDNCHTCFRCVNHPERKRKNIPVEKQKEFAEYYEKNK